MAYIVQKFSTIMKIPETLVHLIREIGRLEPVWLGPLLVVM